jgi:hypothetical protein
MKIKQRNVNKMSIVFVEYKIHSEHLSDFRTWIRNIHPAYPQVDWYEGAEQPGLIVEIWNGMSDNAYRRMKEARLGQSKEEEKWKAWEALLDWVPGGKDKLHIWRFEKVI